MGFKLSWLDRFFADRGSIKKVKRWSKGRRRKPNVKFFPPKFGPKLTNVSEHEAAAKKAQEEDGFINFFFYFKINFGSDDEEEGIPPLSLSTKMRKIKSKFLISISD